LKAFFSFAANLQDYVNESYKEGRNYDLLAFWNDVCRDSCIRDLMLYPPSEGALSAFFRVSPKSKDKEGAAKSVAPRTAKERLESVRRRAQEEMGIRTDDEDQMFAVGRLSGTQVTAVRSSVQRPILNFAPRSKLCS
jgi:hypothetical protein